MNQVEPTERVDGRLYHGHPVGAVPMRYRREHGERDALTLKVWAPGRRDPLPQGLKQIEGYLDSLGLDRGVLVIFDRRAKAGSSQDRTRFEEARTEKGYAVAVLCA